MTTRVTTAELVERLPDILKRVSDGGERFVIEGNGRVLATLSPPDATPDITWREFVARLAELPKPDDRFAADLEEIHASQRWIEPPDWPS